MKDPDEATDGPPDPQLDPERSPGFGADPDGLESIEVSRPDVTIGEATPRELTASDTEPLADEPTERVLALLSGDDPVERRRAALALADGPDDDVVDEALARAVASDADADVRQFAVEALGKRGGEVASAAARSALADGNPWVRAEAVVALDRIDREANADAVDRALGDDHHAVRRNAAISAFKRRGEGAIEVLLEQADDESERVREWAAHLLAGVDDDRAREKLRALAADEAEAEVVRATAARSLAADPARFRRTFRGALSDRRRTMRGEDVLNRTPDL
ncbi:HEAT repeat domain-containing protein [Salinilacihabitans rarus]|uniref:HEAT repeat domain-containing protein n=1 Tax=Salinilacihabitans rarus TaxID=2961596 RepID=UPI0020C89A4B|nr:HEAT repeat domain-containing protein [Salinilacihabitans rarus]